MNGLRRRASDCADGEGLGRVFGGAVVAFGFALAPLVSRPISPALQIRVAHSLDDLDLSVEASRATLYQRDIGRQAHFVDVPPRIQIIQRVEDDAEALEPRDIELAVLDVVVVRYDADVGVEPACRLFGNLSDCQRKLCDVVPSQVFRRTNALDFLICSLRNRNWRLRLLRSMVSRSTTCTSPKLVRTKFLSNSQPMPPAPTIKTRACTWSVTCTKPVCACLAANQPP